MDKIQKPSDSEWHAPSSEPFKYLSAWKGRKIAFCLFGLIFFLDSFKMIDPLRFNVQGLNERAFKI
jgi:hypothetical protein